MSSGSVSPEHATLVTSEVGDGNEVFALLNGSTSTLLLTKKNHSKQKQDADGQYYFNFHQNILIFTKR